MRGLVTLATAFALPTDFPQRDLIVVSAFAVVLATLVVQGLTLSPLIRLLGLNEDDDHRERVTAQRALADAALEAVADAPGGVADEVRRQFEIDREAVEGGHACSDFVERQGLKLEAIAAQRARLDALLDEDAIGAEEFERLQEALDWHELAVGPAERRTIEEG
jgi:CPA1 family monovalent cation:H+ antiporter